MLSADAALGVIAGVAVALSVALEEVDGATECVAVVVVVLVDEEGAVGKENGDGVGSSLIDET